MKRTLTVEVQQDEQDEFSIRFRVEPDEGSLFLKLIGLAIANYVRESLKKDTMELLRELKEISSP